MSGPSPASLRLRLADIDAADESLHSQVAQLAVTRRVVVEQLKLVTFAIVELAVEITSMIFVQYTQAPINLDPRELTGPFVLAGVCKRWRTIALRPHVLWSRMILSSSGRSSQATQNRLRLCLERSGDHVDLEIQYTEPIQQDDILLRLLTPSSARWSTLDITALSDGRRFQDIHQRLSRLRSLKITSNDDWEEDTPQILAFEFAPLLRKVELFGVEGSMICLPWSQLNNLGLYPGALMQVDFEACVQILRQTPQLETLYLRLPTASPSPDAYLPVRLEHLRTLTLDSSYCAVADAIVFIKVLTVPAIVTLTTDIDYYDSNTSAHAIPDLLERSHCGPSIRFLTLKTNEGSLGGIEDILTLTPVLDKLTIRQLGWDKLSILFDMLDPDSARAKSIMPFIEIHELFLEIAPERIPYSKILAFILAKTALDNHMELEVEPSESTSPRSGLRRFELSIPSYDPEEENEPDQDEILATIDALQRIAASPGGPKIKITTHKNAFMNPFSMCSLNNTQQAKTTAHLKINAYNELIIEWESKLPSLYGTMKINDSLTVGREEVRFLDAEVKLHWTRPSTVKELDLAQRRRQASHSVPVIQPGFLQPASSPTFLHPNFALTRQLSHQFHQILKIVLVVDVLPKYDTVQEYIKSLYDLVSKSFTLHHSEQQKVGLDQR
ncbi:hypothetical protein C8F01DRAFT_1232422 [Mycena amicta]|nr:hypothetical protein C8F01DRAFT_1232422 [Mycena amicta]